EAYTTLRTPWRVHASSRPMPPRMLIVASRRGSVTERRTSIWAAWWSTISGRNSAKQRSTAAASVMSAWSKRAAAGTKVRSPLERSTRTATSWQRATNRSATFEPMNPAPPVIRMRTRVPPGEGSSGTCRAGGRDARGAGDLGPQLVALDAAHPEEEAQPLAHLEVALEDDRRRRDGLGPGRRHGRPLARTGRQGLVHGVARERIEALLHHGLVAEGRGRLPAPQAGVQGFESCFRCGRQVQVAEVDSEAVGHLDRPPPGARSPRP